MSDEWQPIETAPKDGTRILVARVGENIGADAMEINHWFVNETWRYEPVAGSADLYRRVKGDVYQGWSGNGHRATHWQPLPEPPEGAA